MFRAFEHRGRDRGATAVEYAGAVALAAVVVLAVSQAFGVPVAPTVKNAVCATFQLEDCETSPASAAGQSVPSPSKQCQGHGQGLDEDRRSTARDTRDERTRPGDDDIETCNSGDPAGEIPIDPLGDPVSGTQVAEPQPPSWYKADAGAGEYGSWTPNLLEQARMQLERSGIEAAANALATRWPDASRNLLHYFGNSGRPLEQDVNRMLDDIEDFESSVDDLSEQLGRKAVEDAREKGFAGPVTFPISTAWRGFSTKTGDSDEVRNWYYANGAFGYNLTGQVTVYPPTEPGGRWRYDVGYHVNMRDYYNWDKDKSTEILWLDFSDDELAKYHRAGWAQEYLTHGRSSTRRKKGTVG